MYYDDVEKGIIEMLQGDIPIEPEPFRGLAEKLDIDQEEITRRIAALKSSGKIRRLGAVLRHRESGFIFNAMVVFKTSSESADYAGRILASHPCITHCYLRDVPDNFGYNLFAMIHLKREEDLAPLLDDLMKETGLNEYQVIKSIHEYKKISMEYI